MRQQTQTVQDKVLAWNVDLERILRMGLDVILVQETASPLLRVNVNVPSVAQVLKQILEELNVWFANQDNSLIVMESVNLVYQELCQFHPGQRHAHHVHVVMKQTPTGHNVLFVMLVLSLNKTLVSCAILVPKTKYHRKVHANAGSVTPVQVESVHLNAKHAILGGTHQMLAVALNVLKALFLHLQVLLLVTLVDAGTSPLIQMKKDSLGVALANPGSSLLMVLDA